MVPSEDDSLVFSVNPITGDGYKLRATDTRQKQEWINRLRLLAEDQTERKKHSSTNRLLHKNRQSGVLANVNGMLTTAAEHQLNLARAIEDLPNSECFLKEMLELKATSQAVLFALDNSVGIVRNCLLTRQSITDVSEQRYSSNDSLNRQPSSRQPSVNVSADGKSGGQQVELGQDALKYASEPITHPELLVFQHSPDTFVALSALLDRQLEML